MKLTQNETKIKLNKSNLFSLSQYLTHLAEFSNTYMKPHFNNITYLLHLHNVNTIREKVGHIFYKSISIEIKAIDLKHTLKLTEGERLTFYAITTHYPLPMDINFIEYEINKRMIKNN